MSTKLVIPLLNLDLFTNPFWGTEEEEKEKGAMTLFHTFCLKKNRKSENVSKKRLRYICDFNNPMFFLSLYIHNFTVEQLTLMFPFF